ncbi:MAG: glycoside hydrolase family 3 protein [Cytophagales bacterium]|nr:glycoside hydrolase family 3 protein [Cytophagales bacterium]
MNELERQVGQAFCPAAFIHDTSEGIAKIERYIRDFQIGGLTFFYSRQSVETNFDRKTYVREKDSVQQLARMIDRYQQLSKDPLLISIDAEWGLGMRIDSHPPFPYPLTLAAARNTDLAFEMGRAIAQELKAVGIQFNLAPVVDINNNPENPVIGYRSFGEDPEKVFDLSWAYYQGMKSEGLLGCVKHFPGHGDTHVDSHLGIPAIDKSRNELDQNELYPFKQFVERGIECVMVGHLLVPELDAELPASISPRVINGLLRDQWGFQGAVMSDALNMRSVFGDKAAGQVELQAFNAGNDILCFTPNLPEAFERIVNQGDQQRVALAADRVMELKKSAKLIEMQGDTMLPESIELRERIAYETVTVLKPVSVHLEASDTVLSFFCSCKQAERFESHQALMSDHELPISEHLGAKQEVWVVAIPPSQKPGNQFGMSGPMLTALNELIEEQQVNLAWLGNPYSMKYVNWRACRSVVLARQSLPEMEKVVFDYWEKGLQPNGQQVIASL